MRHGILPLAVISVLTTIAVQPAVAQLGRMDLLTALDLDLLRAEFRGNGESSVVGQLWRAPNGPQQVTVDPGTQFWAQLGGRQGMGTLGQNTIDFGSGRMAQVSIPTACTNIGLPAPTRRDIMVPSPCPDPRVARIASMAGTKGVAPAAAQVAIWAVANDPPRRPIESYLKKVVKALKKADSDAEVTADSILTEAATLLRRAEVSPEAFQLFK
jgi:hypothetical protein